MTSISEKLFKFSFPLRYEAYQYFKNELRRLRFKNKIVNTYDDLPCASKHDGELWEVLFESGRFPFLRDFGKYLSKDGNWIITVWENQPLFNHVDQELIDKFELNWRSK